MILSVHIFAKSRSVTLMIVSPPKNSVGRVTGPSAKRRKAHSCENKAMTEAPPNTLLATFLPDGKLLLELLMDWYRVLATAETHLDAPEDIARIVTAWATSSGLEARPRRLRGPYLIRLHTGELSHDYSRGLAVPFAGRETTEVFGGNLDAVATLVRQVRDSFHSAQAKARARLAGGYSEVLAGCLDRLRAMRSDQAAYRGIEHTLVEIVRDERYLRLAGDERARELVAAIDDEISFLYGQCADLDRGGNVR